MGVARSHIADDDAQDALARLPFFTTDADASYGELVRVARDYYIELARDAAISSDVRRRAAVLREGERVLDMVVQLRHGTVGDVERERAVILDRRERLRDCADGGMLAC
jgi:hypothetical protein